LLCTKETPEQAPVKRFLFIVRIYKLMESCFCSFSVRTCFSEINKKTISGLIA
jgi:hypothetical protein